MVLLQFYNPNEIGALFAAAMTRRDGNSAPHVEAVSTLRDRTPQPQEQPLEEAEVVWGQPSNFTIGQRSQNNETGPYVQTTWNTTTNPDNPPDEPQDLPPIVYEWTETAREETTVRIDGPDGAYVDDARAVVSTFQLPPAADGRAQSVRMTFLKFNP